MGYDTATLTKDVLAVLDSLRLARVTLVSHSFGGSEATWLAAHYPARVERLIYLDSAFDLKRLYAWPGWWDSRPEPPKMTAQDSSSLGAYAAYVSKLLGATLPESDLAAKARFGPDGRLLEQDDYSDQIPRMRTGAKAAPFREVRAPALVIYAEPRSGAELFPFWDQLSGAEKEKGERYFRIWHHAMKWQWHHVAAELRGAQIVRLPAATHFVYLSRRFEVEHLMRAFLSGRSVFGGGKPPNKRMQLPTLQVQGT